MKTAQLSSQRRLNVMRLTAQLVLWRVANRKPSCSSQFAKRPEKRWKAQRKEAIGSRLMAWFTRLTTGHPQSLGLLRHETYLFLTRRKNSPFENIQISKWPQLLGVLGHP